MYADSGPSRGRAYLRAAALGGTLVMAALSTALAADGAGTATAFHIPPQPLGHALAVFSEVSGNTLLADGLIIEGRRSAPLDGVFTPEAALAALLNGTGLEPKRLGGTSFTLALTGEPAANRLDHPSSGTLDPDLLAAVQKTVLATLCQSAETRPGTYGAILHLWIDLDGRIEWIEQPQSSGNSERDAALKTALRGLQINDVHANATQAVTVVLQPQPSPAGRRCRP